MKKTFIIILNFNGKKDTLECLQTLKKSEIIVVDNGSSDGSVEAIKKKFPQVKLIENKKNLGFVEGNNMGIKQALEEGSDYILLLNNDTLVDKNLLVQLISAIGGSSSGRKVNKTIGIVSPKIYFAPGFEFHRKRYKKKEKGKVIWYAGGQLDWHNVLPSHRGVDEVDRNQYDQTGETDFATGCCMLIRKEVFNQVGLFDKKYFLYWEDIDLCQRAKKAGFKVFYTGKAQLWHKNASASGGAGKKTSVYYQTRNRLLFALKYAGLKAKAAVFKEALGFLAKGNQWQKKAVKDFFLLKFGKLN